MTNPERDALQARRGAIARQLAQGLAEQSALAELQALQARLQLIDSVLAAAAPRRSAWRRHALAALAVAALVSAAALIPLPRVSFVLDLDAGAAQLLMADSGSLAGQQIDGEVRAEGFDRLESGDSAWVRRATESGTGQLVLQAQRLRLSRIMFAAGARLDFEAGASTVRLAVDGTPHTTELEFGGQVASRFAGSPSERGDVAAAEWLRLHSAVAPTELWLARPAGHGFAWRGLRPGALRLVERQAGSDGQVRLVSALRQATLRLPATGTELRLPAGSGLEIDGLRVEQADLVLGEHVAIKLSGSAQHLVVDRGGFKQSLRPSLLDYAAHNHRVGLLWSAAGLLWGISSWLRKVLGEAG